MSRKNLNAKKIPKVLDLKLKNRRINQIYKKFEKSLNINKNFIVAVSGGPDSLALSFLSKIYSIKKNLKSFDIENLGAEFYGRINYGKNADYYVNSDTIIGKDENFIGHFIHGLRLKSYEFDKYKSKKTTRIIC